MCFVTVKCRVKVEDIRCVTVLTSCTYEAFINNRLVSAKTTKRQPSVHQGQYFWV